MGLLDKRAKRSTARYVPGLGLTRAASFALSGTHIIAFAGKISSGCVGVGGVWRVAGRVVSVRRPRIIVRPGGDFAIGMVGIVEAGADASAHLVYFLD